MQACSNCGALVRDRARFCTTCGTQLNEAGSGSSAFSWGAVVEEQPPTDEPYAPEVLPATDVPEDNDTDSEEPLSPFAWNWDSPPSEDDSVVGNETDVSESAASTDGQIDSGFSAEEAVIPDGETEPIHADAEGASAMTDAENSVSDNSQDTLASWAQDWNEDDAGDTETDVIVGSSSMEDNDDDDEATVAKAERLISQLQAMIPRLARPLPTKPQQVVPTHLADELDNLNDGTDWSDLRQVLEQARDNPHDINHLMTVSGNADRLLSLLDSREHLARTASDVASRLRNPPSTDSDSANDEEQ